MCRAVLRNYPRAAPAVVILVIAGLIAVGGTIAVLRSRAGDPAAATVPAASSVALSPQPALRPTGIVTFADGCLTAACHSEMKDAAVRHTAAADIACQTCHGPDSGGHRYPLLRAKSALCVDCHDAGSHQPIGHGAVAADGCLACHQPHASSNFAMLTSPTAAQMCAQCHAPSEGAVRHPPYDQHNCQLCHNPHGSSVPGLLRQSSVAENCGTCHPGTVSLMASSLSSHRKVKGSCTGCHSPHAAPVRGLLATESRETCLSCHSNIAATLKDATISHAPLLKAGACVQCHDPHASQHTGMLRATQAGLCLSCHDKPVKTADKRTIPAMKLPATPAADGAAAGHNDCAGCHTVHGGDQAKLLSAANPVLPRGPYDRKNYALCFSCHDPGLAEYAAATQFRDGDRNLHQIHLSAGDRSRACTACHSVHDTGEPRHIAKSVSFEGSGWLMPTGYVVTPEGGRCGSGCHEPLEYSRRPGGIRQMRNGGIP